MTLGEIILNYRKENGISQRKFAEICGNKITHGYISMLEKNQNPNNGKPLAPSIEVYKVIAEAMRISLDELLTRLDGNEKVTVKTENKDDMWELREAVRRDPQVQVLFDLARDAKPADIRAAIAVLQSLKGNNHDDQ